VRHQLSKVVLLYLRRHKLSPPHTHGQSWTAQFQNAMSVLRPNNPELAQFVMWALVTTRSHEAKYPGMDIDTDNILKWEGYVWHMQMLNAGSIDNRMHEWTRTEDGDADGPTRVDPYTPNTYSDYVVNLISQDANGMGILVTISKLVEPTAGSATDRSVMPFFDSSAEQCPHAAGAWTFVLEKANQVNASIAKGTAGEEMHRVSQAWMKALWCYVMLKYRPEKEHQDYVHDVQDDKIQGFNTAPSCTPTCVSSKT
jgi:hypothetical protein